MSKRPKTPIFGFRGDWWHNACLNTGSEDWKRYSSGYREAADLLVAHVRDTHSDQDTLVYPIVFLYRQYLELELKGLLLAASRLLNSKARIPHKHALVSLWLQLRPLVRRVEPECDPGALGALEAVLREFDAIDAGSMTFRYPVDRDGANPLAGRNYLNIVQFSEAVAKAVDTLEGLSSMLAYCREVQSEMLADLSPE